MLDENLSHETVQFLQGLGYEAVGVAQLSLDQNNDETILSYAVRHSYILITFDLVLVTCLACLGVVKQASSF